MPGEILTLDLHGAKRLDGYKPARRRTLGDPGTVPQQLLGGGGAGGYAAAKVNRLTLDFLGGNRSADQELFSDNKRLRARGRQTSINDPFGSKFLQMVPQNVIGPDGILVKSTVTSVNDKDTAATEKINKIIDDAWNKWCRRCTADGKFSLASLARLSIRTVAAEGESLTKLVYDRSFYCGIALQPLDNDQLDDAMMMAGSDGSEIRMGVEVDRYRRPVAYHLFDRHPNDMLGGSRERKRIPAELIVHTAKWDRPGQTRGVTWMAPAMLAMNQYHRYEEAVVVAARSSAAKFATIEREYPDGGFGPDDDDEGQLTPNGGNADGTNAMSGNAGEMLELDYGQKLNFTDPRFPTNTHKDFTQTMLRNIASGLLVMYTSLASDLEGVNFSSIRAGLIDERDMWRILQRWFGESWLAPIRLAWLKMALLTEPTMQGLALTADQMEQYSLRGRGWDWVDPMKDSQAIILKLGEGLTTYEIECAKLGYDWQELAVQRKREQDYLAKIGVVYGVDITGDQGGKGVAAGDEDEAAVVSSGADDDKQQGKGTAKKPAGKK